MNLTLKTSKTVNALYLRQSQVGTSTHHSYLSSYWKYEHMNQKGRSKTALLTAYMIFYVSNSKHCKRKLCQRLINQFSKFGGYIINIKNSIIFTFYVVFFIIALHFQLFYSSYYKFFFLTSLACNQHTVLCKFNVYSIMTYMNCEMVTP